MLVVGGTCAQFGIEPEITDFLMGAKELIEDARTLVDKGIQVREWDQVKVGCAMIQCVLNGVAAVLGLPYLAVLELCHAKYMNAEQPTEEELAAVLRAAGFEIKDEPE
jgi:hypothetical protein